MSESLMIHSTSQLGVRTMSRYSERPPEITGTVLEEQIEICDDILEEILDSHSDSSDELEDDPYQQVQGFYREVQRSSIRAFEERSQASALYDGLKMMFRKIAEERGYEHRIHYTDKRDRNRISDSVDNVFYWFKLYAGGVLEIQPDISYEWAVRLLKEHRDGVVTHPTRVQPLRTGPDPTLVSSIVPFWYALEDVLILWRQTLDMDQDRREHREKVLRGEENPEGSATTYRFGFIRDLHHNPGIGGTDAGYITDYKDGEDGNGVRFKVGQTDFFPTIGDIVTYWVESDDNGDRALNADGTVKLVE